MLWTSRFIAVGGEKRTASWQMGVGGFSAFLLSNPLRPMGKGGSEGGFRVRAGCCQLVGWGVPCGLSKALIAGGPNIRNVGCGGPPIRRDRGGPLSFGQRCVDRDARGRG